MSSRPTTISTTHTGGVSAVLKPQTREAYQGLLHQGWNDAVRSLYPKERMYSYWVNETAYRRGHGFRLAFLLLTKRRRRVSSGGGHDRISHRAAPLVLHSAMRG